MSEVKFYLLGSPRLEIAGKAAEMDTRKAIALLAYLMITGQEQQRDSLAALFWPDYDQVRARAALRRTLSTLHKALQETGLVIGREAIAVDAGARPWLDVTRFQTLASGCARHAPQARLDCADCLSHLEQADRQYQADFMEGFNLRDSPSFDEWQFVERESLRRELAGVLEKLAQAYARSGDYGRALVHAQRWLGLDPLMEEPQRLLMQLYARAGQRSAALRQYRDCVRILEEELGVAPLEETTQLYQEIMSGKWDPGRSQAAVTATSPGTQAAAALAEENQQAQMAPAPLVGRSREWHALLDAYQAPGLDVSLLVIEGEAGIGKTRLAQEYLAFVRSQGGAVIESLCYIGEAGLAYAPFLSGLAAALVQPGATARLTGLPTNILTEASRLLPGLAALFPDLPAPTRAEGAEAQTRFFEALRQVILILLSGERRGVLFIDDLQWADSATLDLFTYLVRRLRGAPVQFLAAWRSESSPAIDPLNQALAESNRSGLSVHITLPRLAQFEIGQLAISLLPSPTGLPEGLAESLYRESEGLPFFAVETLRTFGPEPRRWSMPGSVRDLLHQRLASLGETARQVVTAAAVIGWSFDFDTLRAVSGRSELETVTALEELIGRGIITERPGSGPFAGIATGEYDFTHEKLCAMAYEETSLARRRLLHLRTAESLAAFSSNRKDGDVRAGMAAVHYQAAGQTSLAAEYFRRAGEHERRLHANREALSHFQAALAAGVDEPTIIYEAIGDLHTLAGDYAAAIESYQAASAFCKQACLAGLLRKLGQVYHRRGEWEQAVAHFQSALEAASGSVEAAWQAGLYADWSLTAHLSGHAEHAASLAELALKQARTSSDPGALAHSLNVLGVLARARGDLDQAVHSLEGSLAAASRLADPAVRAAALNNLARVLQECGQTAQAIPLTRQALELCIQLDDRHRQAALHNNLADLYHAAGLEAEAMTELKHAVSLFAEIKENPELPEIWKLTEW